MKFMRRLERIKDAAVSNLSQNGTIILEYRHLSCSCNTILLQACAGCWPRFIVSVAVIFKFNPSIFQEEANRGLFISAFPVTRNDGILPHNLATAQTADVEVMESRLHRRREHFLEL